MKRAFDLTLSVALAIFCAFPIIIVSIFILCSSRGPILFWSRRIGKDNKEFYMPKFRTMHANTPVVATDLLDSPERYITPLGFFLRKTSLDELPQIWCVITGSMSIVGPRPALSTQSDLIASRTRIGVHRLVPGLTGLAQINGRDHISMSQKVELDHEYLLTRCLCLDIKIVLITISKVLAGSDITH